MGMDITSRVDESAYPVRALGGIRSGSDPSCGQLESPGLSPKSQAAKIRLQQLSEQNGVMREQKHDLQRRVARAKLEVEERLDRKTAENFILMEDNEELLDLMAQVRELVDQREGLKARGKREGFDSIKAEVEVLRKKRTQLRFLMDRSKPRPAPRTSPGQMPAEYSSSEDENE
eukprot:TRINITY_DN91812_c0_g1_i1.p1 TRINITY_DN91812_c0_g1~~TRINITY_DN91812_c0_g1_i1.p1  ORF type:complete len:174 (+),score=45.31 TRINITY_DN91812_c0_g1_i1:29-550(+)